MIPEFGDPTLFLNRISIHTSVHSEAVQQSIADIFKQNKN